MSAVSRRSRPSRGSQRTADQIFSGRSHYQISQRHSLNVNARYRQVMPNESGGITCPNRHSKRRIGAGTFRFETAFLSPALAQTRFQHSATPLIRAVHKAQP